MESKKLAGSDINGVDHADVNIDINEKLFERSENSHQGDDVPPS